MGEPTDPHTLSRDLGKTLRLLARDAVAASLAAGMMPGVMGLTLAERLRDIAAAELADMERLAARMASLGGSPSVTLKKQEPPAKAEAALDWLAGMQREAIDAVVEAIPADADDAEGEATEHLLEHIVSRKRDVLELLDRALR